MTQPYEAPEYANAAEFTVTITVLVAGGQRHRTADERSKRVFERLANHAARAAHVLQVHARGGPSTNGETSWATPVAFSAANTGTPPFGGTTLACYRDPDFDRALTALAAANAAARQRRDADRMRRRAVGCANAHPSLLEPDRRCCACAYCRPLDHLDAARPGDNGGQVVGLCLCGQDLPGAGRRCLAHRDVQLQLLDGDPAPLQLLADYVATG